MSLSTDSASTPSTPTSTPPPMIRVGNKPLIVIVYYSLYGHIGKLAKTIAASVEASGADVKIYQVPETLPEDILTKMHAPAKDPSVPVITDPSVLLEADAIIFGINIRYGMLPSQMKAFLDSTGKLWATGGLVGKLASVFFSTGSVAGGQEVAAFTMTPFFTHHGMLFVPLGYANPKQREQTVHGGSAWGSGTIAGSDGSRLPTEAELDVAVTQGKLIVGYATTFKKGKALLAETQ